MKNTLSLALLLMVFGVNAEKSKFPDGSKMSSWFSDYSKIKLENLGKQYVINDFGVKNDSTIVQIAALQAVIDKASESGGIVVIPEGVFLSGALFFKPNTHLYISEDAKF
jgi:polygalacturonase